MNRDAQNAGERPTIYLRSWYGEPCIECLSPVATSFVTAIDVALQAADPKHGHGVLADQGNPGGIEGGRSFLPVSIEAAKAVLLLAREAGLEVGE